MDIEHHARWAVRDNLPLLASGRPVRAEVTDLRTNDFATRPALMSAVCGTLDFGNADDGVAHFVLLYSLDDDGKAAMVARPFLYGRVSERNFAPRYEAALSLCGEPVEAAVAAETEAAADAAR